MPESDLPLAVLHFLLLLELPGTHHALVTALEGCQLVHQIAVAPGWFLRAPLPDLVSVFVDAEQAVLADPGSDGTPEHLVVGRPVDMPPALGHSLLGQLLHLQFYGPQLGAQAGYHAKLGGGTSVQGHRVAGADLFTWLLARGHRRRG